MDIPPSSTQATGAAEDFDQTIKVRTPSSGAVYFNRYRLKRVLGRGGMGVVWLADDLKLERPVALKFLPSLIGLDPAAVKELKTETRQGLELSHPNIVRIYDFVDDEDEAAISMEFVDGKTLSELRATTEHGVFTTQQVAKWLPGVCEALDYAHFQRKVVHRDLKPSNIMAMNHDDTAKIADFGIARSISDTMQRLSFSQLGVSGTLPYMSPQQAMGERPAPTDDVYSLGATIYELLSGKPPFYRGDIPSQLTSKIPSSMLERREELEIKASDTIPKEWEEVIAACLQKDPSMRPPSAGKLLELLGLKSITSLNTQTFISPTMKSPGKSQGHEQGAPKSHVMVYAAAAVAVVAAGAAIYFSVSKPPPPHGAATPGVAHAPANPTAAPAENAPPQTVPAKTSPVQATPATVAVTPPAPAAPTAASPAPAPAAAAPAVPAASAPAAPVAVAPMAPAATAPVAPGMPAAVAVAPVVAAVTPAQAAYPAGAMAVPVQGVPAGTPGMLPPAPGAPAQAVVQTVPGAVPVTMVPGAPGAVAAVPDATMTHPALAKYPPAALVQPRLSEPPQGFWSIEHLFPTPPQSTYSESGRRHLLYEVQRLLKEKSLYNSTQDGKEGKGTHNAIMLFQAKSGLIPNGLLDGPTLIALSMMDKADDEEWRPPPPPSSGESGSGFRRRSVPKEDPNFLQRAGKSIGRFFNQDD
ncbi:serine/threonine-protein kinase [Prosthecobacter vanneervenii]|uniref:Serine/threonine protein kinase n=1 Tax=Prosthecobacter vanneervenii TaxID=48466 RepID=A0A7W7YAP4_9BACT|nr:serine/threonine-protein kinase [Prosthecobacter vanneervenii]MBB5032370.1 serine/threonine protein kinase [Prosthecobacter vanneervenii]